MRLVTDEDLESLCRILMREVEGGCKHGSSFFEALNRALATAILKRLIRTRPRLQRDARIIGCSFWSANSTEGHSFREHVAKSANRRPCPNQLTSDYTISCCSSSSPCMRQRESIYLILRVGSLRSHSHRRSPVDHALRFIRCWVSQRNAKASRFRQPADCSSFPTKSTILTG